MKRLPPNAAELIAPERGTACFSTGFVPVNLNGARPRPLNSIVRTHDRGRVMMNPITYFEVAGPDANGLADFYAAVFGLG